MTRGSRRALWFLAGLSASASLLFFGVIRPLRAGTVVPECPTCARSERMPPQEVEEGFHKLHPPKPGEWRWTFPEQEQSFERYIGGTVNRKCEHRTTFYLQPLGGAGTRYRETLERMRTYAEAFFGVPAKVLDPIPLFEDALNSTRGQYDASRIIQALAERHPPDALVYIGITEKDLYSTGLNFVFGQGSLHQRCGVYSLVRYQNPDERLFMRRSLKLLSHEAGHILSIDHCTVYSCVMQGANTLEEDDSHPMHLCPTDLRKVLWNAGLDRDDRYLKLAALYREWGLAAEALWVAQRLGPR
jgi:archaemetzincin